MDDPILPNRSLGFSIHVVLHTASSPSWVPLTPSVPCMQCTHCSWAQIFSADSNTAKAQDTHESLGWTLFRPELWSLFHNAGPAFPRLAIGPLTRLSDSGAFTSGDGVVGVSLQLWPEDWENRASRTRPLLFREISMPTTSKSQIEGGLTGLQHSPPPPPSSSTDACLS